MKSTYLLVLASLAVCNLPHCNGQSLTEDDPDHRTIDDIILQKAESLLLRSILKKIQGDDERYEGTSQPGWVTKRQHPGKRYTEEDLDVDAPYLDVNKRQHPGKREEEMYSYLEPQKRQHPGKRTATGFVSDNPLLVLSELSKRQHPGKRYLMLHTKRQHPGKRFFPDADSDFDSEGEELAELEKRQHPGKRFLDNSNPFLGSNPPCDFLDSNGCSSSQNRLLLDFLDNINTSHVEEKRQHPGKRFASEEDLVDSE
ncbi:pro-thyrotropin-releasing hormone [Boleophthalmus pectinirostris]|uniref:pro-thyrotropin-releasing hormone n=1 Tax=Boleophthalmus pectinirostris TaxID=150288 RepID=UPI000A1C293B|nr:pro-thyrotropin-releasing hormone [Boleophthalmus pectinirostris]